MDQFRLLSTSKLIHFKSETLYSTVTYFADFESAATDSCTVSYKNHSHGC